MFYLPDRLIPRNTCNIHTHVAQVNQEMKIKHRTWKSIAKHVTTCKNKLLFINCHGKKKGLRKNVFIYYHENLVK